jgi:hypothetical protein
MQPRATKTAVPEEIRSRAGVGRIDYEVAFCVVADPVDRRSAEQWARAMYESPPAVERLFVWYGWKALTARLGPYPSEDHVLGYRIEANEQDYIRFSVEWALGLACDLVLYTGPSTATLASFVSRHETRTIPIPPELVRLLRAHIKRYGTTPDGRVFQTTRGGIIQDSA